MFYVNVLRSSSPGQFGATLPNHLSFEVLCRGSEGLYCDCTAAHLLPLSNAVSFTPHISLIEKSLPNKVLVRIRHLRVCFPGRGPAIWLLIAPILGHQLCWAFLLPTPGSWGGHRCHEMMERPAELMGTPTLPIPRWVGSEIRHGLLGCWKCSSLRSA